MTRPGAGAGAALVAGVFVAAICGLVYELVAGALSSYLLGDSVQQFSLAIGIFLAAMGVGSWLSQFVRRDLLAAFLLVEVAVGVIGGCTALVGFAAFAYTEHFALVLFGSVAVVGALVGLEIPLVVRLFREIETLPVSLANVLSADYAGALVAAVAFPFWWLPSLGLVRAGLAAGLANVAVAGVLLWRMPPPGRRARRRVRLAVAAGGLFLAAAFAGAGALTSFLEDGLYQDEILYARDSAHQRIVLTRWRDDLRLYLDGHLQFSSVDEYRYHEALVHPAMGLAARRERVLVLGGGDGLAVREVLRHPEVRRVDLVDLDPAVTELFASRESLARLNGGALGDPRVRVHHHDAFALRDAGGGEAEGGGLWDVVLMDLPDPSEPALAKLYSRAFYSLAARRLAPGGVLATQATSPFRSREAFWCIVRTLEAVRLGPEQAGLEVRPYHAVVPSFGTWGFVLAGRRLGDPAAVALPAGSRYLDPAMLPGLFAFPPDMARVEGPIGELDRPVVDRLYREGYREILG